MKMRTFVIFLGLFFITAAPIKADIPMPGQIESYNSAHCGPGEILLECHSSIHGDDSCTKYKNNKNFRLIESMGASFSSYKYCTKASFSTPFDTLYAYTMHVWIYYKDLIAAFVCIVLVLTLFLYRRKTKK